MKYFVVFDGRVYFKACSYDNLSTIYPACLELNKEEYDSIDPSKIPYYFDGEQWRNRPIWAHENPITVDETQTVTFVLPDDYTELRINNSPTTKAAWTPPGPGTYTVRVEPFPYMPLDIEIIVTENLEKAKERKIEQLEKDCNQYILSHYPLSRQNTFKAKYIQIVEELAFNSDSYTTEQKDALNQARTRMRAVMSWIDTVLSYFYDRLEAIKAADDVATVKDKSWDFSQFDASDPEVTIEEIRGYLSGILWG